MTSAVDRPDNDQEAVLTEIRDLKDEVTKFNQKFDNYQKATQWVVQLAFSLIAAATVTVIISTVTGK